MPWLGDGASAGRPLPSAVQAKIERSLGADFSAVRVHEGPEVAAAGAEAFTRGDAVHFRPGAYDPHSATGQELLGHELTHVVQQRAGRVSAPQGKGGFVVDAALEAEADAAGARAARGEPAPIAGRSGATSAPPAIAQPKLYLGGKKEPEPELPDDVAPEVLRMFDQATLDQLKWRVETKDRNFEHTDWKDAAAAAFRATRTQVDPRQQPLLWYGKDSEQRNVDPQNNPPPGQGQFRESTESRRLTEDLLARLGELRRADTLGKGNEGQWKEAIMVGVMITVLGKRYAAKSGAMTPGFDQAARGLGLQVVNRGDDRIIGFSPTGKRASDPVAQMVDSTQPEASAQEVGQAPGRCAMPKLISEVAATKGDTPESATEKLFSPDKATDVYVKGEGGEVAKHGHGCSVPSCITCRKLTELQLQGAPRRDDVLSAAEQGYVANLDAEATYRNQQEEARVTSETKTNRNRVKHDKAPNPIAPARVEPVDRAASWVPIQKRVAAAGTAIASMIDEADRGLAKAVEQKLSVWAKPNASVGVKGNARIGEDSAVRTLWRDKVTPALKALCDELQRDYRAPPILFPEPAVLTIDGLRRHVSSGLAVIEDRARSSVARQFGSTL